MNKIKNISTVIDLNAILYNRRSFALQGATDEHPVYRLRPDHGLSADARIPKLRATLPWRLQNQTLLLSRSLDKTMDLTSDQTIVLTGPKSKVDYPEPLRRVRFYDRENDRYFTFLTNNFIQPALTIAKLYKLRWRVELFFRWIKQNLRIIFLRNLGERGADADLGSHGDLCARCDHQEKNVHGPPALQFFADFERDRLRESPIESIAYVFGRS